MKKMSVLFSVVVALGSIFFFLHPSKAVVVPSGPPVQGSAIQGNCTDGANLRCSTYYGSPAAVNSNWDNEGANGVGIGGALNQVVTPANPLDVNGAVEFGGGTAPAANGSVQFKVTPLNASTTGQIVNTPASPTADIAQFNVNGTTGTRISKNGGTWPQYQRVQVDALTPDYIGETISVNYGGAGSNYPLQTFMDCKSTGTAIDQWMLSVSSTNAAALCNGCNGCGVNR